MEKLSRCLANFNDSAIAFGVGASCYIGIKAIGNKKYTYAPYVGKAFLGTSAIASLYLAGCFKEGSCFSKYIGAGIPIPGLGGMKLSLGIGNIKDLSNNVYKLAQDNFKNFQKVWLSSSE